MGDSVERFSVNVSEEVLGDLRRRIVATRWPQPAPGAQWEYGTDLEYMKDLCSYWADGFDWPARERELNEFDHFTTEVDGSSIHFVYERAAGGRGIPLILTHGWPSNFVEMLPLVPLLTDPAAHGIEGPSFDVVIPSLPGYGFSERPFRAGVTTRYTAGLWHQLMRRLGYERYGAHGTDMGAFVTKHMALQEPEPMIGIHLSFLEGKGFDDKPASKPLSEAQRTYLEDVQAWLEAEAAYSEIQRTKPQTLAYGLNDSPAGLASWILEKWRSWADSGGDLDKRFSRNFLLTLVTIYWVTQTMTTSMRDYVDSYYEEASTGPEFVDVPTGFAVFSHNFVPEGVLPREWAEQIYNVKRWTLMPRGGHFAAVEEPELLARDVSAFFGER
jgi:pimeloyl-ACP methyl ester carboxylesterase